MGLPHYFNDFLLQKMFLSDNSFPDTRIIFRTLNFRASVQILIRMRFDEALWEIKALDLCDSLQERISTVLCVIKNYIIFKS